MNRKLLLLIAISPVVLMSQVSLANTVKKTYETNFKYTHKNCKKAGFSGGRSKFNGKYRCVKGVDFKLLNQKPKSSRKWKLKSSKTPFTKCNNGNKSCTVSLSTGANDCISSSSSTSHSVGVTASMMYGIGIKLLSGGGSISYGHSWTETKGSSKCVINNLNVSCQIGPDKQVRLVHTVVMQAFQADVELEGSVLHRQKISSTRTTRPGRPNAGKRTTTVTYGPWKTKFAEKKHFKKAVVANLPIDRFSVCDVKKL